MGRTDNKHTELSLLFGRKFVVDQTPLPTTPGALALTRKEQARKSRTDYNSRFNEKLREKQIAKTAASGSKTPSST